MNKSYSTMSHAEFKSLLETMAKPYPTEPGFQALLEAIPRQDLEAALKDKHFKAKFEKVLAHEIKKHHKRQFRKWLNRDTPLPKPEVSEDAARYEGHKDDVETFEGTVSTAEEEGPKLKKTANRKSPKKQIVSGIEMPHVPRIKNSLDRPKEEQRHPSYLKSVPYQLVRNPANPEAPFGYDANDRPIRPPLDSVAYTIAVRPQPEPPCTENRHNGSCDDCKEEARAENERRAQRERVARPAPLSSQEQQARDRAAMLPHVRDYLSPEALRKKLDEVQESPRYVCLRELLGISYDEILSWFPRVIAKKIETTPYIPDKEGLQRKIDQARARIAQLEVDVRNMSAKVRGKEFLKDGSPNPSYLDAERRAELKREFKRDIAKETKTIKECRNEMYRTTAPVDPKAKVRELTWREEILKDRDFKFEDLFQHWYVGGDRQKWTEAYKEDVVSGLGILWSRSRAENEMIQYAISRKFCPAPSLEIQDKFPWIMRYAGFCGDDGYSSQEENDSSQESKLILKTGGDQIGGQIAGAGVRFNSSQGTFTPRAHWDFDAPLDAPSRGWDGQPDEVGSDAHENPEEFQPD